MIIPIISTRGLYSRSTGMPLKKPARTIGQPLYKLEPVKLWQRIFAKAPEEMTIFIHGMRNTKTGSRKGGRAVATRLHGLGYKYPVVVFSYDSDVTNAGSHNIDKRKHAVDTAKRIVNFNCERLLTFMIDVSNAYPKTRFNFICHSLGCYFIPIMIPFIVKNMPDLGSRIGAIHLIGSPIETKDQLRLHKIARNIHFRNYINPFDPVIREAVIDGSLTDPVCLTRNKTIRGFRDMLLSRDHRIKSYMEIFRGNSLWRMQ